MAFRPDVVLLDRNMPGMDGISCGKRIMENDPAAKIIIMSGYGPGGSQPIDSGSWEWIRGYLTKPVHVTELSRMLGMFG